MLQQAAHKVKPHHLEREACLYVRQSSLRQVTQNLESTRRQYGLRRAAVALGWRQDRIRVIDDDQGQSGAYAANRSGFRDLRTRVANGEVGIVLCLEVSRLARDNCEWSQLVQFARLTGTLILDESGVHDPTDSSEKLLLDIKGTISEFGLSGIRARLLGGLWNKARRGELKIPLPIGLVHDEQDRITLDPDREIVSAVRKVFAAFRDRGSAMQVTKWFRQQDLLLPHRARNGPSRGQLRWSCPDHATIRRILRNPSYAGAFVYGRTRTTRQPDGSVRYSVQPPERWEVCIPDHHPGLISWDEYQRNQRTLAANARAFVESPTGRTSAPRNGRALLQGIVVCGRCGRRMRVRYTKARPGRNQLAAVHYVCAQEVARRGGRVCQTMRAEAVDGALEEFVIGALNRESVALALAVQEQVRTEFARADEQRGLRIDRLLYEANLAQRRFYAVDPANRLVAAPLEAAWNERLRELQEAEADRERRRQACEEELAAEQVRRIEELASDFGRAWNAPRTRNVDRKRLLALLVEDVTLTREGYEATAGVRLRGGRLQELGPVRLNAPRKVQYPLCRKAVALLDEALEEHSDSEAAMMLNQAGLRRWNGERYTVQHVYRLRARVGMKGHLQRRRKQLRAEGYVSATELAAQLGISDSLVRKRSEQGRILRAAINTGKRRTAMYKLPPSSAEESN